MYDCFEPNATTTRATRATDATNAIHAVEKRSHKRLVVVTTPTHCLHFLRCAEATRRKIRESNNIFDDRRMIRIVECVRAFECVLLFPTSITYTYNLVTTLQFRLPLFRPSPKEAQKRLRRARSTSPCEHRRVHDGVLEPPFRFSCPFLFAAPKKQPPSRRKRFITHLVDIRHPAGSFNGER